MSSLSDRKGALGLGSAIALLVLMAATSASAETLLMPKRDFLKGTPEVVWGVSTQPANASTTFDLDYGDGSAHTTGNFGVMDRSYITPAVPHTFALAGVFTITLTTVNGATTETATVQVNVYDGATLTPDNLRGLNINRAIQDGLRFFWASQNSRAANFPAGVTTTWPGSYPTVTAALTALAFENHGYSLPNNDSVPTGIYEKYIVRRAINYAIDRLQKLTTGMTPNGGDPCAGPGIEPVTTVQPGGAGTGCVSLFSNDTSDAGYEASIAILPLAGSNAFARHVAEITGTASSGYVVGKTYGEILQRQINGLAWGQIDVNNVNRGGWGYTFNSGGSDGSTIGWNMLALLDADPNTVIPAFVKPEFSDPGHAGPTQLNPYPTRTNIDGTFDYRPLQANNPNAPSADLPNMARSGIGLQALFYMGFVGEGNPIVASGRNAINLRWVNSASLPGEYTDTCGSNVNTQNKGCAYAMFNVFKGLKIQGITSLPGVNCPTAAGCNPAKTGPAVVDWYAEYQDFLVSTQTSPNTTGGGNWGSLVWSCCGSMPTAGPSALAELILAPVALVQPDPDLFSSVGLSPQTDTNPVNTPHTVTALVQSSNGTPIAGATVGFDVLSGPNEPASGVCNPVSCISGGDGKVTWTYNGGPNTGNDKIRANIGSLLSNVVDKFWIIPSLKCDANGDGVVTQADLNLIRAANGQVASGASDPRDGNSDGAINVLDYRYCQFRLTPQ
jgi:hypothetical protein